MNAESSVVSHGWLSGEKPSPGNKSREFNKFLCKGRYGCPPQKFIGEGRSIESFSGSSISSSPDLVRDSKAARSLPRCIDPDSLLSKLPMLFRNMRSTSAESSSVRVRVFLSLQARWDGLQFSFCLAADSVFTFLPEALLFAFVSIKMTDSSTTRWPIEAALPSWASSTS